MKFSYSPISNKFQPFLVPLTWKLVEIIMRKKKSLKSILVHKKKSKLPYFL